jgi:hypothetical protein
MAPTKIPDPAVPYSQWRIEKLSDLVNFLELHCKKEDALFRGQAADWPLRPKLARLKIPRGQSLLRIEEEMLDHFERAVVAYMPTPPASRWELCALAQHHGMATRLLDWTYNPLAALWFALERSVVPAADNAVVWMFWPSAGDAVNGEDLFFELSSSISYWKPRYVSPRIRAQGGVFTVHSFDKDTGTFRSLQEAREHHEKLTKILVPRSAFAEIRYQLDRCGINAATVYPDIDGLARHIEWLYSYYAEDRVGSNDRVSVDAGVPKRGSLEIEKEYPAEPSQTYGGKRGRGGSGDYEADASALPTTKQGRGIPTT